MPESGGFSVKEDFQVEGLKFAGVSQRGSEDVPGKGPERGGDAGSGQPGWDLVSTDAATPPRFLTSNVRVTIL